MIIPKKVITLIPFLFLTSLSGPIFSLEDETIIVLTGLRVSDAQIKFYEDTLRVLVTGRTSLVNDLKAKLKDVDPIKEEES